MNVVIRPVNDRFLTERVFPAFEQGTLDAGGALQQLRDAIADERIGFLLESLLDGEVQGGFYTLDADRWVETVYHLLFDDWEETSAGWRVRGHAAGYAGGFDATLALTLLIEERGYPYSEAARAAQFRDDFQAALPRADALSRLVCGAWDPFPKFAPDQVLNTQGRGFYRPQEGLAVAEWSFRSAMQVTQIRAMLPVQLKRLMARERERLTPLPEAEVDALLGHWLEGAPAPKLSVAFSGLGAQASHWSRDLGALLSLVRQAANKGQGLTCVMTHAGRQMADGLEAF